MERRRMLHIFKVAKECGPYDELPALPDEFDLQLHLSRNDRPQPFYLICDHDTVLVQMSGEGRVEFKDAPVLYHTLEPGDWVYVPAGTPHRLVPDVESVQVRYKAQKPALEGVAWYCQRCGAELWRDEWELAREFPQEAYLRACQEFNADTARRTCSVCGAEHPSVELSGFRWHEIAQDLRQEGAAKQG